MNNGEAAIDYAAGDGGILPALSYQVAGPIERGELVEVLASFARPPLPIQAVFPTSRLLSANVRVFLDLAAAAARVWRFP